jgi:hypothetical protein
MFVLRNSAVREGNIPNGIIVQAQSPFETGRIVTPSRMAMIQTEKPEINPEKSKEMQERARERNLIRRKIKTQGSSTIDELSKATSMEKSNLLKHLIAMGQFGKNINCWRARQLACVWFAKRTQAIAY